jgi:general secretion pathway protein C
MALALVLRLSLVVTQWSAGPATATGNLNPLPASQPVDVASVQALQLFGNRTAQPANALANLATTELELVLDGVMLATPGQHSQALIASGGHQRSYHVGETLPAGNNVTLEAIAQDHVLIHNNGVEQVLWLFKKNQGAMDAASGKPAAAVPEAGLRNLPGATATLPAAPQQRRKAAVWLAEVMTVEPAIANGHLIGYRVNPGMRLKEFVQLGFQQGDVLTSANGISLTDMANLPELYNLMNRSTDVSFSLLRDGQPLSLQMTLTH